MEVFWRVDGYFMEDARGIHGGGKRDRWRGLAG